MESGLEQGSSAARSMTWALRVAFKKSNGVHVLGVAGRLSGSNAAEFEAALEDAARKAERRLVVDLSGSDYLSSRGLIVIETAAARCREAGGMLVLVGVTDPVRITLELAGLVPQISIQPSIEAASRALV
jgi:anti-anti-sigma factor